MSLQLCECLYQSKTAAYHRTLNLLITANYIILKYKGVHI